jgi:hypothetical protein
MIERMPKSRRADAPGDRRRFFYALAVLPYGLARYAIALSSRAADPIGWSAATLPDPDFSDGSGDPEKLKLLG